LAPITCPWIIIQGDHDEIVSPKAVYEVAEKLSGNIQLHVIQECSHFFHGKLIELRELVTQLSR